jgi:hypothetical protein
MSQLDGSAGEMSVDGGGVATASLSEGLRPMSLGEILDRAVQMLRSHFLLFVGITVPPALATLLHSLVSEESTRMGRLSMGWRIGGPLLTLLFWLATVILSSIAAAVKCRAASEVLLGRQVTVGSAYDAFRDRIGRLIGMSWWIGLLCFWPLLPAFLIGFTAFQSTGSGPGSILLLGGVVLVCMIPCAVLYARYILAYPATAILDASASDSIRRSVDLGRGFRWKVFWSFALPIGIGMAIAAGGGGLLGVIGHWEHFSVLHPFLFALLVGLWTFAASLLYSPLMSIAITLTYYDLCVRKEAFDIVRMLQESGLETEHVAAPESFLGLGSLAARPAPQSSATTSAETPGETL